VTPVRKAGANIIGGVSEEYGIRGFEAHPNSAVTATARMTQIVNLRQKSFENDAVLDIWRQVIGILSAPCQLSMMLSIGSYITDSIEERYLKRHNVTFSAM